MAVVINHQGITTPGGSPTDADKPGLRGLREAPLPSTSPSILLSANTDDGSSGQDFRGQSFTPNQFVGAHLQNANFRGVYHMLPNFQGATLVSVDFAGGTLRSANFRGATFIHVSLRGVPYLYAADFSGVNLSTTDLTGADLTGAKNMDLEGGYLGTPRLMPDGTPGRPFVGTVRSGWSLPTVAGSTSLLTQAVISAARRGNQGASAPGGTLARAGAGDFSGLAQVPAPTSAGGLALHAANEEKIAQRLNLATPTQALPPLAGVDFRGHDLKTRPVHFERAVLQGATFDGMNLEWKNFQYAEAQGASFLKANLSLARFAWAKLEGASFAGADLRNADFRGVDLRYTNLDGADLRGAVKMNLEDGYLGTPLWMPDGTPGRPFDGAKDQPSASAGNGASTTAPLPSSKEPLLPKHNAVEGDPLVAASRQQKPPASGTAIDSRSYVDGKKDQPNQRSTIEPPIATLNLDPQAGKKSDKKLDPSKLVVPGNDGGGNGPKGPDSGKGRNATRTKITTGTSSNQPIVQIDNRVWGKPTNLNLLEIGFEPQVAPVVQRVEPVKQESASVFQRPLGSTVDSDTQTYVVSAAATPQVGTFALNLPVLDLQAFGAEARNTLKGVAQTGQATFSNLSSSVFARSPFTNISVAPAAPSSDLNMVSAIGQALSPHLQAARNTAVAVSELANESTTNVVWGIGVGFTFVGGVISGGFNAVLEGRSGL